jgi:ribosomal protein S18 acetylase RimI-like enzyme
MSLFEEPREGGPRLPRLAVAVRPVREEDLDALAALRAQREGEPHVTSRAALQRKLARPALFLVAEHAGERVAYASAATLDGGHRAPRGWYLTGVVVAPACRRRGVATALTRARLDWLAERTDRAYYFANTRNRVSIALHEGFGFREKTRAFTIPGVTFQGGEGILFELVLRPLSPDGRGTPTGPPTA